MILFFPSKNECAKLISITVLSRAFVGILLESFWRLSLMTAVSKSGAQWIGNWRLRLENLSRILLGVPFFDDSGALYDVVRTALTIGFSWSPDGAHITASNATNNKGFVFINPHIFLRNPAAPVATSNICSVVALGADDRSVSIWQTKSARPIIVAKEVFERQIMDLSW